MRQIEDAGAREGDTRKIALYARKSKVTESGKSVENQIARCRAYAALHYGAREDDLLAYRDEGLSGFYADRPEYMRMLRDIRAGRVRAVICYKFDRISRRTLDLLSLVDQLRAKKIAFVSCTDEVDTGSRIGKIVMSLLASIAEFERDIIAERITDNMAELAKEGRWLGGQTPLGFRSEKGYIPGAGGKRRAVHHLEPVEDELDDVRALYGAYLETGGVNRTVEWARARGMRTRSGALHTRESVRYILTNPVYARADADTCAYFKARCAPVYAREADFDGVRGLMAYNKHAEAREPCGDSTALRPRYARRVDRRDESQWVVAVGGHSGAVSGRDWVRVQETLSENRGNMARPHEKTQALLAGKIVCPQCGRALRTRRESGRFTEGRPRFRYCCAARGEGACAFRGIRGNELDDHVLRALFLLERDEAAFRRDLLRELRRYQQGSGEETTLRALDRQIAQGEKAARAQAKNLRGAGPAARGILLEDLDRMGRELEALRSRRAALASERPRSGAGAGLDSRLLSPEGLLEELSYEERRALVRGLVDSVRVSGGTAEISLLRPADAASLDFTGET